MLILAMFRSVTRATAEHVEETDCSIWIMISSLEDMKTQEARGGGVGGGVGATRRGMLVHEIVVILVDVFFDGDGKIVLMIGSDHPATQTNQ